jgi:hypothetical protein
MRPETLSQAGCARPPGSLLRAQYACGAGRPARHLVPPASLDLLGKTARDQALSVSTVRKQTGRRGVAGRAGAERLGANYRGPLAACTTAARCGRRVAEHLALASITRLCASVPLLVQAGWLTL